MRWHRRLAPWTLVLIAAHGGAHHRRVRAGRADRRACTSSALLIGSYPGILAAAVGFVLLVIAGLTSARIARRRMRYETWWAVHLYTYLALALSFSHQLATGAMFVGHPLARVLLDGAVLGTAGVVLAYRILLPLWRSTRHQLRVAAVAPDAPGVVSVVLEGKRLRLHADRRGPVHPAAVPQTRPVVAGAPLLGLRAARRPLPADHRQGARRPQRRTSALEPGTRVAIEGPYGAFTADARRGDRVLMIGAGVGVTPLRAMLEDLPLHVDTVLLARAHDQRGPGAARRAAPV